MVRWERLEDVHLVLVDLLLVVVNVLVMVVMVVMVVIGVVMVEKLLDREQEEGQELRLRELIIKYMDLLIQIQ
jgi:hypothetical protein